MLGNSFEQYIFLPYHQIYGLECGHFNKLWYNTYLGFLMKKALSSTSRSVSLANIFPVSNLEQIALMIEDTRYY